MFRNCEVFFPVFRIFRHLPQLTLGDELFTYVRSLRFQQDKIRH